MLLPLNVAVISDFLSLPLQQEITHNLLTVRVYNTANFAVIWNQPSLRNLQQWHI